VVRDRPVVFLLGEGPVGKSTVAARICGLPPGERPVLGERPAPGERNLPFGAAPQLVVCGAECLRKQLNAAARHRGWNSAILHAERLLLDSVEGLRGRYGALDLLGGLLRERACAGRLTVLCQGPNDASVTLLYGKLDPALRSTVLLRFPEGRGRRRFVAERCRTRGIAPERAAEAIRLEPWSYAAVDAWLDALPPPAPPPARRGRKPR
jgi:hypothetical protein